MLQYRFAGFRGFARSPVTRRREVDREVVMIPERNFAEEQA